MNFVLIVIDMRFQRDVVSFVAFYGLRVAYRPTLAIFVAHKRLPIVANFAPDADRFR